MLKEIMLELLFTLSPIILTAAVVLLIEISRTDVVINLCQKAKRRLFK